MSLLTDSLSLSDGLADGRQQQEIGRTIELGGLFAKPPAGLANWTETLKEQN